MPHSVKLVSKLLFCLLRNRIRHRVIWVTKPQRRVLLSVVSFYRTDLRTHLHYRSIPCTWCSNGLCTSYNRLRNVRIHSLPPIETHFAIIVSVVSILKLFVGSDPRASPAAYRHVSHCTRLRYYQHLRYTLEHFSEVDVACFGWAYVNISSSSGDN